MVPLNQNLVDVVWGEDRPSHPKNPIYTLDQEYSGETHTDKIKRLRNEITKQGAKAMVVTMLDEVAWLFNLRGSDIAYNPVFFAYAVVTQDSVTLFVEKDQLDEAARQTLGDAVVIQPYSSFFDYLRDFSKHSKQEAGVHLLKFFNRNLPRLLENSARR